HDEDLDAIVTVACDSGLSHITGHEDVSLGSFERKPIALGNETQRLVQQLVRDLEPRDADVLSAPGEAAETDGGGGDSVAVVAAVEGAADDRKGPGACLDGKVQLVDDRPEQ